MKARQAVATALGLLSRRDRRRLFVATGVQIATSFLDLIGVLLLGLVGALAVTTVQSQPPPSVVESLVASLGLGGLSDQSLLVVLSLAAAAVLLIKSALSALLLRRVFRFLASRQAVVSSRLARSLLSRPITFLQRRSSQETSYALVQGAGAATLLILGQAVIFISEAALLLILGLTLLFVSPLIAVASIVFFGLVAALIQLSLGHWAARAGTTAYSTDIASLDLIQEVVTAYREVTVTDRRALYVERLEELRWRAAKVSADLQFINTLPKYIFEVALVVGGFALAGFLLSTQDVSEAVGTLALFLAAATRVMPSILRIQGASLSLRNTGSMAAPTFEIAEGLDADSTQDAPRAETINIQRHIAPSFDDFHPGVELINVTFTYPGADRPAVQDTTLSLREGQSMALVGSSGAGKSTLADLILGVLEPDEGSARLGGLSPAEAVMRWPGAVAYVPQDVVLANASIRENVALGLPRDACDDELIWEALERAHLMELLVEEREGLDTHVGERGVRLSGGQRQRLGIARALYTRPRLVVLDEATSALDAETEQLIGRTIKALEGSVTTVLIAHRLSTVRDVDQVVYLEKGNTLATGSFEEVRAVIPSFDRQAAIMGLR